MILIGVGANLPHPDIGPPLKTCGAALDLLAERTIAIVRRSRWYRSDAWPPSDQPQFVNGVAELSSALSPERLLAEMHRVESALGRVRGVPNAARVIDLDLLDYDGMVVGGSGGGLVLPHPRLAERAFVLFPLRELAPRWRHPIGGAAIDDLIDALPPGQVCTPLE